MTENEFIDSIYRQLRPGMDIVKPRKTTKLLRITHDRKIYYRIGENNEKYVSEEMLRKCYRRLSSRNGLSSSEISDVAGANSPCNKTTIEWILKMGNFAALNGKVWLRQWE
jgi:hypothetical protein